MKAYSQDLRERVLQAIDQGKSRKEVGELFRVSLSTIKRYLKQRSEVGHVHPKKIPGRPPTKRVPLQETLVNSVEAKNDLTLQEYGDLWEKESGIKVSIMTVSRALDAVGLTRKKNTGSQREKRRRKRNMEKTNKRP
jgi:transposase